MKLLIITTTKFEFDGIQISSCNGQIRYENRSCNT